jgi:type 1 glutamine amidotransferase
MTPRSDRVLLALATLLFAGGHHAAGESRASGFRVLVVASTDQYHWPMAAQSEPLFAAIAKENGFAVDFTRDGAALTDDNLARYGVVVQLHEAPFDLSTEQQDALQGFILRGGGWVGVHAAGLTGKQFPLKNGRYWQWFEDFFGGVVYSPHPRLQKGTVVVEDRTHPVTRNLPPRFEVVDEWYEFDKSPRPNVHVLATADESTYRQNKPMGDHPLIWTNPKFDRTVYIGIGHDVSMNTDPNFEILLRDAILWARPPETARFETTVPAEKASPHRAWRGAVVVEGMIHEPGGYHPYRTTASLRLRESEPLAVPGGHLIASSALPLVAAAPGQVRLEPVWTANLGPPRESAIHRLAVCPDGESYLTDRQGRLLRLGADGAVVTDKVVPALERATDGACSTDGNLTISHGDHLVRLMRGEEAPRSVQVPPELGPTTALARGKDGEIVTLNGGSLGSSVHRLDRAGSWGKTRSASGRLSAPRHLFGRIIIDSVLGNTALFLHDGTEALLLDSSGGLLRRVALPPVDGLDGSRHVLIGVARAADGTYVLEREAQEPTTHPSGMSAVRSHVAFEVLDFQAPGALAKVEEPSVMGDLEGADDAGNLYFVRVQRGDVPLLSVTKARLWRSP